VAKYERYPGGLGVLRIKGTGMDMVDVVVATGITMQYSWDQTRKLRTAAAGKWRREGVSATAESGQSLRLVAAV
jgi:hypothetical protein